MHLVKWVLSRLPECAIFVIGILLRLTMSWRFEASWGYDAQEHWKYVEWLMQHWSVATYTLSYRTGLFL
jgi:hypothetical protein